MPSPRAPTTCFFCGRPAHNHVAYSLPTSVAYFLLLALLSAPSSSDDDTASLLSHFLPSFQRDHRRCLPHPFRWGQPVQAPHPTTNRHMFPIASAPFLPLCRTIAREICHCRRSMEEALPFRRQWIYLITRVAMRWRAHSREC